MQERVLRFRAWDNKNKKFPFIGFHLYGEITMFDVLKQYTFEESLTCLEFQQFTGVQDKHGNDIYEGDIVRWNKKCYDWDKPEGEEEFFKEKISFIEYVGHSFWVNDENFGWEGEDLWDWNQLEVIGNVYQHSDLLPKEVTNEH